jgi:hypothetical protein
MGRGAGTLCPDEVVGKRANAHAHVPRLSEEWGPPGEGKGPAMYWI